MNHKSPYDIIIGLLQIIEDYSILLDDVLNELAQYKSIEEEEWAKEILDENI